MLFDLDKGHVHVLTRIAVRKTVSFVKTITKVSKPDSLFFKYSYGLETGKIIYNKYIVHHGSVGSNVLQK